jgi:hypothetical protein
MIGFAFERTHRLGYCYDGLVDINDLWYILELGIIEIRYDQNVN